ncbi:MAG: WGR domain-containing protein [Rubripirellula sp.]
MSSEQEPSRRFEYFDGKSAKFWCIELDGNTHTVTYGRTGTDGQTKAKDFADHDKARKSYDKLITQKTGKGYVEIGGDAPSDASTDGPQADAAPFLNAIAENPDNVDSYAVYADWLIEHGDPQGELMILQIALESDELASAKRKTMQKSEAALLKKHARNWLGDLAPYLIDQKDYEENYRGDKYEYKFQRGFLHSISVPEFDLRFGNVLNKSPHLAQLRELIIDTTQYLEEDIVVDGKTWTEDDHGIVTLLSARLPELRKFRLGFEDFESCHTEGEGAIELLRHTPKIEHLHFAARSIDTAKLFKMKLPNLKTLIVHHLTRYPIPILAKNASMSNLETLCMFPHGLEPDDEDAYLTHEDIKAICTSKHLKSLKHLQFMASDIGDKGITQIVSSGLIDQLNYLDLTYGCVTDEGVKMLIESDGAKQLDKLILDNNAISDEGVKSLKAAGINFSAKEQFASVDEEREYLWYGDPE